MWARRKQSNRAEVGQTEISKETIPIELCIPPYTSDNILISQSFPEVHPIIDEEVSISDGFYKKFEKINCNSPPDSSEYESNRVGIESMTQDDDDCFVVNS